MSAGPFVTEPWAARPAPAAAVQGPGLVDAVFLLFVFWFASNLVEWVLYEGGARPFLSYIALVLFAAGVAGARAAQHLPVVGVTAWLSLRPLCVWLYAFTLWVIVSYLASSQSAAATQTLVTRLEMVLVLASFACFLGWPGMRRRVALVLALVTVAGAVLTLYDFLHPTFSKVPGRGAGIYYNPTIAGLLLTLSMTAAFDALGRKARWLLVLLTAAAVFVTFSRGSWIVFTVSALWLVWSGRLAAGRARPALVLSAVAVVGALAYGVVSGDLHRLVAATPVAEYVDESTLSRLSLVANLGEASAEERQSILRFSLSEYLRGNPLFGHGLGHTADWDFRVSTHNMYLLFLVEGGLVGLGLYLALLGLLWRQARGLGRLIVAQLVIHGLFTHNLMDSPGRILFFAIAALWCACDRGPAQDRAPAPAATARHGRGAERRAQGGLI